jgi:hypothetical protein
MKKINSENIMSFSTTISDVIFINEFINWLNEKGFVDDRSWNSNEEREDKFYSFVKGIYRFEILLNWNKKYDSYKPIVINFIDCSKEIYPGGNILMYLRQKHLLRFEKPISRSMFNCICEEYEL